MSWESESLLILRMASGDVLYKKKPLLKSELVVLLKYKDVWEKRIANPLIWLSKKKECCFFVVVVAVLVCFRFFHNPKGQSRSETWNTHVKG